jgi:uncharacterized protein (DUF302 family)
MDTPYGLSIRTTLGYQAARQAVIASLKQEGFGVLTEIDVQATLKAKLNADFRKYTILGACNRSEEHTSELQSP